MTLTRMPFLCRWRRHRWSTWTKTNTLTGKRYPFIYVTSEKSCMKCGLIRTRVE